ncbi:Septin-1 [Blattella germanica]|nr:Septin-1 [Blattella germanica]
MSSESVKTFASLETPGYVGFANLPNQVHRKSVKKGFEFTLMVVGESGLGKSTLVNSLFLTDLYPERVVPDAVVYEVVNKFVSFFFIFIEKTHQTVKLDASTVEIEERGVKLRLTVVDTPGYGDAIDNTDSLKPLDIEFMKQLHNKVNIVPVIAKADVLTKKEVLRLKKRVRQLKEAVPFAVCGANTLLEVRGRKVRGRLYPWGVVEVENPDHCDFIKLRTMLIVMAGEEKCAVEKDRILQEKEAELRRMQEMLAQMQAQMQQQQP